jgi:hypothetical protein
MRRWLTFGYSRQQMREPLTFPLVALTWLSVALLVWAFSPWSAFR